MKDLLKDKKGLILRASVLKLSSRGDAMDPSNVKPNQTLKLKTTPFIFINKNKCREENVDYKISDFRWPVQCMP